jgi:signal peptidase I
LAARPDFTETVMEALRHRGRTTVRIYGRSMYPTLRHGMRVVVQPVAYDELQPGDLVVFCDGRGIVCHRLLRKGQRLCTLKGDTNLFADPPVVWSQVLGRVTHLVDTEVRIHAIDTPRHRKRALWYARLSYPRSLYYTLLHFLGGCRWWTRGIEFREP